MIKNTKEEPKNILREQLFDGQNKKDVDAEELENNDELLNAYVAIAKKAFAT